MSVWANPVALNGTGCVRAPFSLCLTETVPAPAGARDIPRKKVRLNRNRFIWRKQIGQDYLNQRLLLLLLVVVGKHKEVSVVGGRATCDAKWVASEESRVGLLLVLCHSVGVCFRVCTQAFKVRLDYLELKETYIFVSWRNWYVIQVRHWTWHTAA